MDPIKAAEKVFVVPREPLFQRLGYFQGFRPVEGEPKDDWDFIRANGEFRARGQVEEDPSWQQIIPYIAVFSTDGNIFVFQRTQAGGEKRLFNLYSIGIGGHINPPDAQGDPIMLGLRREFEEELEVDAVPEFQFRGYLNGDELPVDRVHFGLVFSALFPASASVLVRERDKMTGEFMLPSLASDLAQNMEGWSKMLLPAALEFMNENP